MRLSTFFKTSRSVMSVLTLTRWALLSLLFYIEFTVGQNLTVLVHFGSGPDLASVVAADADAVTYSATHTNMCRSGPCSPLTIYTNIMIQGESTAVRTNMGGTASQTIACAVTSSLMTGTCTYVGSVSLTDFDTSIGPMSSQFFRWEALTVTAGLEKLSGLTIPTTSGVITITNYATVSTPSVSSTPATVTTAPFNATSRSGSSAGATASNNGTVSTVFQGTTRVGSDSGN